MYQKLLFLVVILIAIQSCTKEKTDYEADLAEVVSDDLIFKEVGELKVGDYTISYEAVKGKFYTGYNAIKMTVFNAQGNRVSPSSLNILPLLSTNNKQLYGPHSESLVLSADKNFYEGYVVFQEQSTEKTNCQLQFELEIEGKKQEILQDVNVEQQNNKNLNLASFLANDGEAYIITLVSPVKPNVAENPLVAGIFKLNRTSGNNLSHYSVVDNYVLRLDPRMPEPSMGNHSSLNNKDLTQQADGYYHGIVNYTMTGNWTLNLILENQYGKIIKGTVVPKDFTPGVQGVKSELFIDIMF